MKTIEKMRTLKTKVTKVGFDKSSLYLRCVTFRTLDTEEASETDIGRHEEPLEIKEQMYQDKLASLKKKLQQLQDGTHMEYNRKVKKLEYQYKERIRLNTLHRDYMIECVERDYVIEKKAAAKEFDEKKVDLKENLISDLEDKRRTIEAERCSMELTGDSMEVKPVMTRKLRRRPNDPVPVPEKRRKPPMTQVIYQLDDKEVENDLKIINRGKIPTTLRKPGRQQSCNVHNIVKLISMYFRFCGTSKSVAVVSNYK